MGVPAARPPAPRGVVPTVTARLPSVSRFNRKWTRIPEVPILPAFFIGSVTILMPPSDSFMMLEVGPQPPTPPCVQSSLKGLPA